MSALLRSSGATRFSHPRTERTVEFNEPLRASITEAEGALLSVQGARPKAAAAPVVGGTLQRGRWSDTWMPIPPAVSTKS